MKPGEIASSTDFVQFLIVLYTNKWKLEQSLQAEAKVRSLGKCGDWCNVNTSLVALFAVLTGQEQAFSVLGAPGHIVGALYGVPFDYPNKEVFRRLVLSPANKYRPIFLKAAEAWAQTRKPHSDSKTFQALLAADNYEEAKALFNVLFA